VSTGSEPKPPYPAHWEADVVLADGGTAHLRPIAPADAEALQAFHLRQSPESTYLRFFAPMPRLSDADAHRFTHVDHVDRVALVATVADEIIGVGRYDRTAPRTAEVAFNVADAHQGRGLGSVLLEHLAAAARENGVHRFVAEVLPQNRRMLGVFRDAGYEVRPVFEDGVVSLSFDIDPTERSLAVMEAREHRAEFRSVAALLSPRSVVLVGASRRPNTVGHRLLLDLLAGDFAGRLFVVHPEADQVLGVPAHRAIADLPVESEGPVDLAVIAVPAEKVLGVVHECAAARVRGLVVISGGFAETGPEGLERQRALVRVARANGMRVVGPKSWGMVNTDPDVRLNIGLLTALPVAGRVGLFCQSGGASVSALENAERRGLGISTFVSAGNRADLSGNDCMQYWEEDERTSVVGLYLESMGNPRKFSRIARRLARSKPVVVVRAGTSTFGVPPGHAVRGTRAPAEAFDAMLGQSGCIRVGTVHELIDVAGLLAHQPLPAGPRVGVVANSEALAALVADACVGNELDVRREPVSVPVTAGAEQFLQALADAVADDGVDSVVAAFVPSVGTSGDEVGGALAEAAAGSDKTIAACLLGMPDARGRLAHPSGSQETVPVYPTPEEAVRALAAVTRYAAWRSRNPGPRVDPPGRDAHAARRLVAEALRRAPDGVELGRESAAELLACYGVEPWPALPASDPDEAVAAAARLGYPVVLKTTAPHLRHRVDLGGVRLDIADADELRHDVVQMTRRLAAVGGRELVVQAMAPPGVACVVRSVEDPLYGPVVSFGLGGDATDLLGDWAHRIPPLTTGDVHELVRSVRAAPKLFGHRGARPVDVAALEDLVARVSCLTDDLPEVAELELNPVVAAEHGAHVLGAVVRLSPVRARADTVRRELTASA
jgi:acyl-CoA synthetase (NDP forming)/RimJ/RimL family protein N-acetyltransferase